VGPLIDIVGHFGTTFSYATVGAQVAQMLAAAGRLGVVMNLDPAWHPAHAELASRRGQSGTHVLLFTAPNHYVTAFAKRYGRTRSAIFVSPNTNLLSDEHAMACAKFGLAIAPSEWCQQVVCESVPDMEVALLPLGVETAYAEGRQERLRRLRARAASGAGCRVMHFSTDQSWPGRKGTEELIDAWAMLVHGAWGNESEVKHLLQLHVPPALQRDVVWRVRDRRVDATVAITVAPERGSNEEELTRPFDSADLVVAPSRCEGFGMMLLASLVAGVPLLCSYNTGHRDFLADSPGWLGFPTPDVAPIAREEGFAPVVEPRVLAQALVVAVQPDARRALLTPGDGGGDWGTWDAALPQWRERLVQWTEATTCPME